MEPDLIISDHYTSLVHRVNSNGVSSLSETDRMIWYIVSARCEKDMEGFDSIFIQLVSEPELVFLIESLRRIDEPELAMLFDRAHQALRQAGFYIKGTPSYYQIDEELQEKLNEIGDLIDQRMWGLDEKLERLIGGNSSIINQGE